MKSEFRATGSWRCGQDIDFFLVAEVEQHEAEVGGTEIEREGETWNISLNFIIIIISRAQPLMEGMVISTNASECPPMLS